MKLTRELENDVRGLVDGGRTAVAQGIDLARAGMNFEIGRKIVEQEKRGNGRAEVIRALSRELMASFGGGFLEQDLDQMRALYLQSLSGVEQQRPERPAKSLSHRSVLSFLGLGKSLEADHETAVLERLKHFLLELGKGFLFEARQRRFTFDGDHFFVDLVFYNRLLRCYVLIDLKLDKLTHQDLGQMQMYVNYFDRHVRTRGEKATVGIILCQKKNEAVVEITLPKGANIHAKEYQLYLPSKEELQRKLQEWTAEVSGE